METIHKSQDFIDLLYYLQNSLREIKDEIWEDFDEINSINEGRFNLFKDILPKKIKGVGLYLPYYFENIPWISLDGKVVNVDFESRPIATDIEHFIKKDTSNSVSSSSVYSRREECYFYVTHPIYKCKIDLQIKTLESFIKYTTYSTESVKLTHDETKWLGNLEEAVDLYWEGK